MAGWRLTFKYKNGGNVIDTEIVGNEVAIRLGLGLAALAIASKAKKMLEAGTLPDRFFEESYQLSMIHAGLPVTEFKGKFLSIEPIEKVIGLQQTMSLEWSD